MILDALLAPLKPAIWCRYFLNNSLVCLIHSYKLMFTRFSSAMIPYHFTVNANRNPTGGTKEFNQFVRMMMTRTKNIRTFSNLRPSVFLSDFTTMHLLITFSTKLRIIRITKIYSIFPFAIIAKWFFSAVLFKFTIKFKFYDMSYKNLVCILYKVLVRIPLVFILNDMKAVIAER
eukprot:NODE_66_length_25735_cov_0.318497.p18 type:complete len:175 gc:universal NODE_66_length_25735_cov_0.318497:735-1259(+)